MQILVLIKKNKIKRRKEKGESENWRRERKLIVIMNGEE